jgi:hypothetical protein
MMRPRWLPGAVAMRSAKTSCGGEESVISNMLFYLHGTLCECSGIILALKHTRRMRAWWPTTERFRTISPSYAGGSLGRR